MAGQQVDDHFAVHGGLENGALLFELAPEFPDVDQIAVVGYGKGTPLMGGGKGLGVDGGRFAGG